MAFFFILRKPPTLSDRRKYVVEFVKPTPTWGSQAFVWQSDQSTMHVLSRYINRFKILFYIKTYKPKNVIENAKTQKFWKNEDNKRTRLSLDEKKKILLLLEDIPDLGMIKASKLVSAKMEKEIGRTVLQSMVSKH